MTGVQFAYMEKKLYDKISTGGLFESVLEIISKCAYRDTVNNCRAKPKLRQIK